MENQELYVSNSGVTTNYFKLNGGARQGDPILAYLFILALEILFILIKENSRINGLNIFDHILHMLMIQDVNSIKEMVNNFHIWSCFAGFRPNLSKCEIAGIAVLKGVKEPVCGMQCVYLAFDTTIVLGTDFSYYRKLKAERNVYSIMVNIERVLKL